ncbi:hypothetical protein E2C01_080531 [Portunus trituberculatus]|uniref:Uncharacterized protein n=1 Tax=Portunus trituberculatus TaxID=210409 RepID=A0A5B7IPH3_PORTR|nr:hypothetical protein [Portunus trituberculatus]
MAQGRERDGGEEGVGEALQHTIVPWVVVVVVVVMGARRDGGRVSFTTVLLFGRSSGVAVADAGTGRPSGSRGWGQDRTEVSDTTFHVTTLPMAGRTTTTYKPRLSFYNK